MPVPSQRRSCTERPSAVQAGPQPPLVSSSPGGTGEQVPTDPVTAQLWQVPVQALSQQTPSAQKLVTHSEPWVQGAPTAFLPQRLLRQVLPVVHWVLSVQELKQSAAAVLHT
jgi:hypothetical protein